MLGKFLIRFIYFKKILLKFHQMENLLKKKRLNLIHQSAFDTSQKSFLYQKNYLLEQAAEAHQFLCCLLDILGSKL